MIEPIEEWRAQQMEAGEGQLHLGFDAGGSGDPTPRRLAYDVVKQRGLPTPASPRSTSTSLVPARAFAMS